MIERYTYGQQQTVFKARIHILYAIIKNGHFFPVFSLLTEPRLGEGDAKLQEAIGKNTDVKDAYGAPLLVEQLVR